MDKKYYDLYYEVLSHYLHFPDVADTFKSVEDGITYLINYPQDEFSFLNKKDTIIGYIIQSRTDNFVYQCQNTGQVLVHVNSPVKFLWQANRFELFGELEDAVLWMKWKGIHQIIKRQYPVLEESGLVSEISQSDIGSITVKYKL